MLQRYKHATPFAQGTRFTAARPVVHSRRHVVRCCATTDVLLRSLSDMGEVAVLVCDATKVVQEVCGSQGISQGAWAVGQSGITHHSHVAHEQAPWMKTYKKRIL